MATMCAVISQARLHPQNPDVNLQTQTGENRRIVDRHKDAEFAGRAGAQAPAWAPKLDKALGLRFQQELVGPEVLLCRTIPVNGRSY